MSLLQTRGLTPGVTNSLHNSQKNLIEMTFSFPVQLCQEILAQRELKKEKRRGRMKLTLEDITYFLHWFPSLYQVGQQADSSAWARGRHYSPSPCLTHAMGSLSAGLRKLGIRTLVNRCHNGQPEHGSIQLHEPKPPLYPQLPLQSILAGKLSP